jgi:hypothetical protein
LTVKLLHKLKKPKIWRHLDKRESEETTAGEAEEEEGQVTRQKLEVENKFNIAFKDGR